MLSRFQKRGAPPSISFFAFQDIITSVIGILIIITLMLSLQLDKVSGISTDDETPASGALKQKVELALREAAALRAEADRRRAAQTVNPDTAPAEAAALRRQIAAFMAGNSELDERAASSTNAARNEIWAAQAAALRANLLAAAEKRHALRQQAAALQTKMNSAETAVKEAEAALLAAQDRKNVLRLIPEKSSTSKEPVLVSVTGGGFTMMRFDKPGVFAGGTHGDFGRALAKLSNLNQYLVFYFKPTGANHFDTFRDAARSSGFEIGYDVIGEQIEFEF